MGVTAFVLANSPVRSQCNGHDRGGRETERPNYRLQATALAPTHESFTAEAQAFVGRFGIRLVQLEGQRRSVEVLAVERAERPEPD
jgi:hypothetical protein